MESSKLFLLCFVLEDLIFFETSALTGDSVHEVFSKCARQILSKIESGLHALSDRSVRLVHANTCWAGVLDPQVMGSGVQHGDTRTAREVARTTETLGGANKAEESCAC